MRDLIERQAAIRKLKRMATQAYIDKLNGSAETVINCCIDVIERQIPSAQPEIISCKDCRYVWNEDGWDNLWCNRLTGSFSVEKDGGCSWGKI